MIDQSVIELEPLVGTAKACALVGKSRATLYRQRRPAKPRPPRRRRVPANALSPAERRAVMDVLHRDDYLDLAVAQVWARELDEGCYHCSMSTMYGLLACHGENRERRRQATHPPRIKPELVARRANEVWTWDITMLRGPRRGLYYPLYSIIDIFSRFVPGHLVAAVEAAELAERMLEDAFTTQGIERGTLTLHADRGGPMTARTVVELLAELGVSRSHSRPRCSNDNPYVEANYKTLKYCLSSPSALRACSTHASSARGSSGPTTTSTGTQRWAGTRPASVHYGTAPEIRAQRAVTLDAAYAVHPERFSRPPTPPKLPSVAWINEPEKEVIRSA